MSDLRLSVVIPAHNEEETLPRTILTIEWALREASIPHEIVVVDDHSRDDTAGVVRRLREQCPSLRLVSNERTGGFGNAVHTGLDAFEGDAVCIVMADGSDDPADIVLYYRKLEEGAECVFGSRFLPQSSVVNYPKHKLLLNRLANLFIRLLFGLDYNDVTNAFKCYRRNVVDGIRPLLSHHFNLTVELPLKAIVRGYSYAVVPIRWYGRTHGISKLRIREMGSRYLFIVLYIFLERRLAGEDYRRVGGPLGDSIEGRRGRGPGWAWLSFATVAVLHLLFFHTYPLNHLGGDTVGYYYVLVNRTSDLLFASGYPVVFSLPLRFTTLNLLALEHPAAFRNLLLFTQHFLELAALALLLVVLTRTYNRLTAALAVLFIGYSPRAMGVTSSVYPEWLQGSLGIVSFALAALAFHATSRLHKTILYAIAFMAFTWCCLVKFNAVAFAPGLVFFFLFEKAPWRERAKVLGVSVLAAVVFYSTFILWFHKPATGTYALTRDRSWVLMTRLANAYGNQLPYPQGIASKRWMAINRLLPQDYSVASVGIFLSVDSVPKEARAEGRKVAYLLTAEEKVVDEVLRSHPQPPGFALSMSFLPISYFVGLKESDDLGVRVFFENVTHAPGPYVRSVWTESIRSLRYAHTEPTFPALETISGTTERLIPLGGNMLRLEREKSSPLPYDSSEPFIWSPGFQFFSALAKVALTRRQSVMLMALGVLLALWHGLRYGWTFRSAAPLAIAILLWGFVVFSHALLEFRWKEWRFAYPLASVLLAITLGWAVPAAAMAIRRVATAERPAKG